MDAPQDNETLTAPAMTASDRSARFRPGMAMRVALGFAAIAIAILIANLVTQGSTRAARERMRQLVVAHEPIVRATEALASAISVYERVVIDRAERGSGSLETVRVASQRVAEAAAAHAELSGGSEDEERRLREFARELELFRGAGEELVHVSGVQRARAQAYWQQFRELEQRLAALPEQGTERPVAAAGESILELSRLLGVVRERVSAALEARSVDDLVPIVAGENAFQGSWRRHQPALAKLHGTEWATDIADRYQALLRARRGVFDMNADLAERSLAFRDQGAALWAKVLTQLVSPARAALANADELAEEAARKADRELTYGSIAVLLLLLVISLVTVDSVRKPVQRLTEATRRLAAGEIGTRVPRGGIRELDALAGAFNHMAAQLQQAETEVRSQQLQLESRVAERTLELQHLAHHDPLTQLPNRRKLFEHLDRVIAAARAAGSRVALLFIDLDNFKTVNDSLGHEFGDSVLKAVGARLRSNALFAECFSARLGGDEFTLVFEDAGDIERLCAAVLDTFQRSLTVQGRELRLSVSVGASVFPEHGDDSAALLRAADVALFRAKELGRSRSSLFAPEMLQLASEHFRTEQALRRAIERQEFELLYQPEVCFETLTAPTVEALLRWRQPDGQVLAPADFLPVAEQSGLIMEISEWVLRTAVSTAAQWHHGAWPGARVAVNVSAHQLLATQFVPRLESLLKQHALPARALELELTENVLQTGAATVAVMHRLRQLGISIALDDFGIGYSSLTSLERLPLTRVKIDRSLTASIDSGTRSPAIVRSIIGLSHSLGLQVTAEGVERPAQLRQLLHDRGVQVQGFMISRPLPAVAVAAFIDSAPQLLDELLGQLPAAQDIESSGSVRALRTAALRKI